MITPRKKLDNHVEAVAIRRRAKMKLTGDEIEFLDILARYGYAVPRSLLPLADRKQDRVRQKCRRLGLAEFVGRWRITQAGRNALAKEWTK